ncbi:hypothetical protein ZIOFF_005999 [Zingiber officinale]|uniref:Signal recognition particle SRP54 helical bundle domain-containing protein n=1 Tax=Zingiber officinale TaxID=94328 RepID=A0A8J5I233_ZINOF|nr:hypothetical protein ZIOFF_005999 [Zingiber officinale]
MQRDRELFLVDVFFIYLKGNYKNWVLISRQSRLRESLLLLQRRPFLSSFLGESLRQLGFGAPPGKPGSSPAKSDVDKLFSGFSKTCESLSVVDELLLYWNLADTNQVLDELEEALLVFDFGPKISFKIVDSLREDILARKLKSGSEIKEALKTSVLQLLTSKGSKTELQLGFRKPAVIMIVSVNGGGKTTSLGNHFDLVCSLAHFPFMLSP